MGCTCTIVLSPLVPVLLAPLPYSTQIDPLATEMLSGWELPDGATAKMCSSCATGVDVPLATGAAGSLTFTGVDGTKLRPCGLLRPVNTGVTTPVDGSICASSFRLGMTAYRSAVTSPVTVARTTSLPPSFAI